MKIFFILLFGISALFGVQETLYFENGLKRATVEYNDSNDSMIQRYKQGKEVAYYEDGKSIVYTVNFDHGLEEGDKRWYDRDGKLIGITPYKHGKRDGKHTLWYSNGNKRAEVTFVNDLEEGIYKEYYEDGELALEVQYKHGKKTGIQKEYHKNGKIASTVKYINGYKEGEMRWYDKDGNLTIKELYKTDVPVAMMKKIEAKKPKTQKQILKELNFNPNAKHIK